MAEPQHSSHHHHSAKSRPATRDHEHGLAHDHAHDLAPDHRGGSHHGHFHHHHAPRDFGRAFLIGISLNAAFVVVEAFVALMSGSMALLADAGHNLSDVLGLAVAWAASAAMTRRPTPRLTYGLHNSTIFAAFANAALTLIAVGAIAFEAVQRLIAPAPVAPTAIIVVAAIGVVINGITAVLFAAGRHEDLNIRGAYLHMASDAAVSLGVVVAGLAIMLTGWLWIDPLTSLAIVAVIVVSTWSLLRESVAMSVAAVPAAIDPVAVRDFLRSQPGVASLHDLHIWPLSTTETALTVHLVMPAGHPGDAFLQTLAHELMDRFAIGHATIQIEITLANGCRLTPDDVI